MVVDDSKKRETILRALYTQYLELPTVVTTKEQLEQMTKLTGNEAARCVEYLRSKKYVNVDHFFGDDFYVKISTRGIDAIENPESSLAQMKSKATGAYSEHDPDRRPQSDNFSYDVAISYAGENEKVAIGIYEALKQRGISCYLAVLKRRVLWGKNLDRVFEQVFGEQVHYVIVLVSKEYKGKIWTDYELQTAIQAARKRHGEYILPVRLDDTLVVGILSTIGYLDYAKEGCDGIADALKEKLSEDRLSSQKKSIEHIDSEHPTAPVRLTTPSIIHDLTLIQNNQVCDEGPFDIEPGSHSVVSLNLHKGDLVVGSLDETNGDFFDWYIVDEKNMVKFKRKEEFDYARGGEGLGAYSLKKWKVSKDGPCYLLLSTYGKQYPRKIHVRLRRMSA